MTFYLHIEVLAINEFDGQTTNAAEGDDISYGVWFFLEKDQSCFVEYGCSPQSVRKPEFWIRDTKKQLQVELFRRQQKDDVERVLVGEAQVPLSFMVANVENHLVVEILHSEGSVAATILLKVEMLDTKGRSISRTTSPTTPISSKSVIFADAKGENFEGELSHSSSASSFLVDGGSLAAVYTSQASPNKPNGGAETFLEKMTLSGSPIMHVRPEHPLPAFVFTGSDEFGDAISLNEESSVESLPKVDVDDIATYSITTSSKSIDALSLSDPATLDSGRGSSPIDVKGLVSLEIVAAQNLPREKRMLRVHYQNNPFVVISFGKKSFKTKVMKRTTNPVWKEKLFFSVKQSEANYYIMFSVYDYDKLSYNSCIGTTNIKASLLLDHPNQIQKLALNLRLNSTRSDPMLSSDACLLVKGCFISYDVLRKNFWGILAKQYDHDDNGKLNRVELMTMLESIGSTLSEETVDGILRKLDMDEDGEVPMESIVSALEDLTVKSKIYPNPDENIVLIETCPICSGHFAGKSEDIDVITHLAICAAKDSGKLDRLVMGGFITEDYASRKWFMKLLSFMTFGGYRIGKNNANILVQDRRTGKLLEEKMPTYVRLAIRWMHQQYGTSRAVDSHMVRQIFQNLTIKQGRKYDDPYSARYIPDFIRYHKINMDEVADPLNSFRNFNEFFYRKLKPGMRILASEDPMVCVSPADCRLNVFPTVQSATELWIKGSNFTIANLLKDEKLAEYFYGGSICICRLAPQDYHRFHSPVDGVMTINYHIPGSYFTVNPMAVRQKTDVYTENARTVALIDSDHFGKIALVAIGAMMVGSIVLTCKDGCRLARMDEIGYFAFGGSTIVVLFPPGQLTFDSDLLRNSHEQLETLVQMGNSIGRCSK